MRCVPKENGIFIPYNLSFIKHAGSLTMAGYWPYFLFRVLMDFFVVLINWSTPKIYEDMSNRF